jgi:hypothetical protein
MQASVRGSRAGRQWVTLQAEENCRQGNAERAGQHRSHTHERPECLHVSCRVAELRG